MSRAGRLGGAALCGLALAVKEEDVYAVSMRSGCCWSSCDSSTSFDASFINFCQKLEKWYTIVYSSKLSSIEVRWQEVVLCLPRALSYGQEAALSRIRSTILQRPNASTFAIAACRALSGLP